jgi:hypothetical protein
MLMEVVINSIQYLYIELLAQLGWEAKQLMGKSQTALSSVDTPQNCKPLMSSNKRLKLYFKERYMLYYKVWYMLTPNSKVFHQTLSLLYHRIDSVARQYKKISSIWRLLNLSLVYYPDFATYLSYKDIQK